MENIGDSRFSTTKEKKCCKTEGEAKCALVQVFAFICLIFARNRPDICPRYTSDIPETLEMYLKTEIFLGFTIFKI